MLEFNSAAASVRYDPYPLVVLHPALEPARYARLAASFPAPEIFAAVPNYPYKLALGRNHGRESFERFLAGNADWRAFRKEVESEDFIRSVIDFLRRNHIAVRVGRAEYGRHSTLRRVLSDVRKLRLPRPVPRLTSRFEFSILRANGGEVTPHTDAPRKIITIVLAMVGEGEWRQEWGGALDVNRTTDPRYAFNWNNRAVPWGAVEIVDSIPFQANQSMVFVKTHNSLHSVRPMTHEGSEALRKSVTIVIERDDEE